MMARYIDNGIRHHVTAQEARKGTTMYYVISRVSPSSYEIRSYADGSQAVVKAESGVSWDRVVNVTQGDFYVDTTFDDETSFDDCPKA